MYVELGKIVGVWGVKGWVKLHSYTRHRPDIAQYKTWYISRQKKGPAKDVEPVIINVLQCREQAKGIVAQLKGVDDRDQAAAMSGFGIWVKQSELPDLPEGEYYWQQLIGMTIINKEKVIGKVQSIIETGANDVLVCNASEQASSDILIPYNNDVVVSVDIDEGVIDVDWNPDYLTE